MSFEEFKIKYTELFTKMMKYSPDQAGSNIYAAEMADLADQYPDWAEEVENG